jgi:hypothetical protein
MLHSYDLTGAKRRCGISFKSSIIAAAYYTTGSIGRAREKLYKEGYMMVLFGCY